MTPQALLQFNFQTDKPEHVNYYLKHNVGCSVATPDGKNYTFTNANPGVIHYPEFQPVMAFGGKEAATTFGTAEVHDLIILDQPGNRDVILVQAAFGVFLMLNPKLLDPRPFVYRQFIKGRCRVADEKDHWWEFICHTSRVALQLPTRMTDADLVAWSADEFREDAERHVDGVTSAIDIRKYGYREAKPVDIDRYMPNQDGHNYQAIDLPGIKVPKSNLRDPKVPGPPSGRIPRKIEAEFHFSARVVQMFNGAPVKVWAERSWSYSKRWRIVQRYPTLKTEPY